MLGAQPLFERLKESSSPYINRFLSADTIVPGYANPQNLNRYSYVTNNPLRYTDPTGHKAVCGEYGEECSEEELDAITGGGNGGGGGQPPEDPTEEEMVHYIASFGITLVGNWTGAYLANLWEALFKHIGYKQLKLWLNGKMVTITLGGSGGTASGKYYGWTSGSSITFYANNTTNPVINMLHEFGHLVDNLWDDYFTNELQGETFTLEGNYFAGWNSTTYNSLGSGGSIRGLALTSGNIGGGDAWQQRSGTPHWEDWGDIFANYMIGNISLTTDLGGQLTNFATDMEGHVMGDVP